MPTSPALVKPRSLSVATFLAALSLVITACTPAGSTSGSQPSAGTAPNAGPKTLRVAFIDDSDDIAAGTARGAREISGLFAGGLTYRDGAGEVQPLLSTKVPRIADGDWTTSADGKMEVTWKLKPNLKWHDGNPVTADDFLLGYKLLKDEASPRAAPPLVRQVTEISAPDAQTIVMKFGKAYLGANDSDRNGVAAVPAHILGAVTDKTALQNHPYWSSEFIGTGPFKLTSRTPGSEFTGLAFDDYVLGRPKIDRVIVRIIPDVNALATNILAGDVDVAPFGSLEPVNASDLKKQWEGAGKGTIIASASRLRQTQLNYRDPNAAWAGDPRVRQAMLHLIDRPSIVEAIMYNLTTVADVPALPQNDPLYPVLQKRNLPVYAFDKAAGERVLDAAGWTKGTDGFRHNAVGAPLLYNPAVTGRPDLPEGLIVANSLKTGGFQSDVNLIEDGAADVNEQRAKSNGITRSAQLDATYWDRFITSQVATEANRWRGNNTGGYMNPAFDRMVEDWNATLDPAQRLEKSADLVKVLWDNVTFLPMYYNVDVAAYAKNLTGPKSPSHLTAHITWDIHTWTLS
jgi:peptide/nickel transport system substrate-binding protein